MSGEMPHLVELDSVREISMKWPRIKDIFALSPKSDASFWLPFSDQTNISSDNMPGSVVHQSHLRWDKIRFDNSIRLSVAIPTYLTCIVLWLVGTMDMLLPMTGVFGVYVVSQYAAMTAFINSRFTRTADILLSSLDLVAMSFSIYYTGGISSPLYFVYFVPLIVHAFHRDWALILINGIGGVSLYGLAVILSLQEVGAAQWADLGARLLFMSLTVGIACLALSLLRVRDNLDRRQTMQLRAVSLLLHKLGRTCDIEELGSLMANFSPILSSAVGREGDFRITTFMRMDRSRMVSSEPQDFSAVEVSACPISKSETCISNHQLEENTECRNGDRAKSSFCVPIHISDGDLMGIIRVTSETFDHIPDSIKTFFKFIAKTVALSAHQLNQVSELRRVAEMGSDITAIHYAATQSLSAAISSIADGAMALTNSDWALVYVYDRQRQTLKQDAIVGRGGDRLTRPDGLKYQGVVEKVVSSGEPYMQGQLEGNQNNPNLLCVPLKTINGVVLGCVLMMRPSDRIEYQDDEQSLAMTYAHRAAHVLYAEKPIEDHRKPRQTSEVNISNQQAA